MGPLRIAILASSLSSFRNWELRLLDKIAADSRFEIAGIVTDGREECPPAVKADGLSRQVGLQLSRLIAAVEEPLFCDPRGESGRLFRSQLTSIPVLELRPERRDGFDWFSAEDAAAVRALGADVALRHGFAVPRGPILDVLPLGIWGFDHAGASLDNGRLLGFREASRREPVTVVTLRIEGGADGNGDRSGGRVIARAAFSTQPIAARNRTHAAEKAVSLAWRELGRLAARRQVVADAVTPDQEPGTGVPSLVEVLCYAARAVRNLVSTALLRAARGLGWRTGMWSLFVARPPLGMETLAAAVEIPPARGEFWADPFLLERGGVTYVFYENYVYATGKGKISAGRLLGDGAFEVLGDALDLPYHLSFPFVFEHAGEIFMVPETCAARRVEVWRAAEFPLKWEPYATALEGVSAADTVLFEDGGQWWMATNISDGPIEDHCNELHLFAIDGPALKHVEPHPSNPVVIDSRLARNAGRIARRDGKLVRPSQNNSCGIYGRSLNLMEITRLDRDGYEERRLLSIEPSFKAGLVGCHHMDSAGALIVVDGCRNLG